MQGIVSKVSLGMLDAFARTDGTAIKPSSDQLLIRFGLKQLEQSNFTAVKTDKDGGFALVATEHLAKYMYQHVGSNGKYRKCNLSHIQRSDIYGTFSTSASL